MIALLIRDLRLAIRAGGGFGLGLAFFLMVAVLVPLGVGPEQDILRKIAPGILWVGALLACLLSLDRIFALDFEDGSLDLLATAPIPMEGVVAVKSLAHWLVTGLPLTLVSPVLGLLMNLSPCGLWLAGGGAGAWHAGAVGDRGLWCGADGGAEAGRAAAEPAGAADVCADADFRRRSGQARGGGDGARHALAAAGRDHAGGAGDFALCVGCGNSRQSAVAD